MARMYGAQGKSGQRKHEERQWRREIEQDVLDVVEELQLWHFVQTTWLPDWYIEKMNTVWVRL